LGIGELTAVAQAHRTGSVFPPSGLGRHFKSGQWSTDQNRPMGGRADVVIAFTS
jgi:hypothetical protein